MRSITSHIEEALYSGVLVGDYKAQVRLTVEPDWYLYTTVAGETGTMPVERTPVRWYQNAANDQTEIEIPNVIDYSADRTVGQQAASCTITIDNIWMDENLEGDGVRLGKKGYFTPHHGATIEAQARWGQVPNIWQNVLDGNALIRAYAGNGGQDLTVSAAVAAGHLMLDGVWIVDDWQATSGGRLSLTCRDVAALLIDQPIYPPLIPASIYPLEYYRYRPENRAISASAVTETTVTPGSPVAPGDRALTFVDSSVDRWYPATSPGSEIPNGGYVLHGHRGIDCLDNNGDTFCLSVGNSSPDKSFCTDWWEFAVNDVINAVYVHPWAGNYTAFVSVMENGAWQGGAIVPYTFYPMNGDGRAVDTGANIPYVTSSGVPWETGIEIPLDRAYMAQRVRISFRDHAYSPWGPWYYRCGMREFRARVSSAGLVLGGSVSQVTVPPVFYGGVAVRDPDDQNVAGYMTISQHGQIDAFGDAAILNNNGTGDNQTDAIDATLCFRNGVPVTGYYSMDNNGFIVCYGDAVFYGSPGRNGELSTPNGLWCDLHLNTAEDGYWVINWDGRIYNFGNAVAFAAVTVAPGEFVARASKDPTGDGLFLVTSNGEVHVRGTATHFGNFTEAAVLNASATGPRICTDIQSTITGNGYWVLVSDGRVQAFGDADDHGEIVNPVASLDNFQRYYQLFPAGDDAGYLLLRGDGTIYPIGEVEWFGSPIPGSTGQLRRPGNYLDYADIIKELALWCGFHFFNEMDDEGKPAVYGNIETTGAFARDPLPLDMFDKKLPADVMKQISEIVGYVMYVDEEGALHWHSPNFFNFGNFLADGSYTTEIPEFDERWNLLESQSSGTRRYDRSEIILSTTEPTQELNGTVTTRYIPPNQARLRGQCRPAVWVNQALDDPDEQKVMAELVALHLWFRSRTANVTGLYHPGVSINDQIRVLERTTGETAVHYVLGKQTSFNRETGELTMSLTTHWLGDRDSWAVTTAGTNSDMAVEQFQLSELALSTLKRRGIDVTSIERPTEVTNMPPPSSPPPPEEEGVATPTVPTEGELPGWTLIFEDDFDVPCAEGNFLSTYPNWYAYPYGWNDTSGYGTYDPDIISVSGSKMRMRIHTTGGTIHHVAAPYPLLPVTNVPQYGVPNRPQLYGRYSVRFRADPTLHGYKVAWLLWPMSDVWPRDGEIDFPEGDLDSTISAFMHRQGATSGSDQDAFPTSEGFNEWHTATIEWRPFSIKFILDDVVIGTSTSRIPNTPMRWVLQTETELSPSPEPDDAVTGYVEVDWVGVWSYTP